MINGAEGLKADCIQIMRIGEHPIQIKEPLLVFDDLEAGTLRIYEMTDGPVHMQQLFSRYTSAGNAVLVAEAIINSNWREEGVFIHKVSCEYGNESLIQPILGQIIHFANFYDCYQSVGMSELEYDKCLPYAKEILAGFEKVNRVYEYQINR